MIHLTFYRVRPGELGRLQAWLAEGRRRADEVRETYYQEGVHHEQAYFLESKDGHVLVYAVECDDYEAAREAFLKSVLPIDIEHKRIMPQLTDGVLELSPALDIRR
jgi:Family of unknown function (DUF6176)